MAGGAARSGVLRSRSRSAAGATGLASAPATRRPSVPASRALAARTRSSMPETKITTGSVAPARRPGSRLIDFGLAKRQVEHDGVVHVLAQQ